MLRPALGAAVVLAAAIASPAVCQPVAFPEAGVRLEVPAEWDRSVDAAGMVARAPDESVVVTLLLPDGESWEAVIQGMNDRLASLVEEIEASGQGRPGTVGGMSSLTFAGRGVVDGTAVEWSLLLLEARRPVAVVTVAAEGRWAGQQGAYEALLASIAGLEDPRQQEGEEADQGAASIRP